MRPRTAIFLLLGVGFGLFAYLRPHQVRDSWRQINESIFAAFGSNPSEYAAPKNYFHATDTLVRSFGKDAEVILTDSSRWRLRDATAIAGWAIGQTVQVHQTEDKKFPYAITNSELNARFSATFLGKE